MKEVVKRGEASISVKKGSRRGKGGVVGRYRDGIASCKREQEARGKGTFEVHVMLHLGKSGKERVKMSFAHDGGSIGRGRNRY